MQTDAQTMEVLKCGPMTTVQDAGRVGYRHLGVARAGVMDVIAQQQANLLLNNCANAAVLEVSLGPLHMQFHAATFLVLMGADYQATMKYGSQGSFQRRKLLPGYVEQVPAGAIVRLTRPALPGQRAFVAVQGGFDVPTILGSRSTDLSAGFGGHQGRALQAGDVLPLGPQTSPGLDGCDDADSDGGAGRSRLGIRPLAPNCVLRAIPGPDHSDLAPQLRKQFWQNEWRVHPQSNRMGLRLAGRTLRQAALPQKPSAGVLPGMVQLPPDGQPIVLGCDAQTIGGYPCIAAIIDSDLWQLAYMPPGTGLMFRRVSLQQAHEAARQHSRSLQLLEETLKRARQSTASARMEGR